MEEDKRKTQAEMLESIEKRLLIEINSFKEKEKRKIKMQVGVMEKSPRDMNITKLLEARARLDVLDEFGKRAKDMMEIAKRNINGGMK